MVEAPTPMSPDSVARLGSRSPSLSSRVLERLVHAGRVRDGDEGGCLTVHAGERPARGRPHQSQRRTEGDRSQPTLLLLELARGQVAQVELDEPRAKRAGLD